MPITIKLKTSSVTVKFYIKLNCVGSKYPVYLVLTAYLPKIGALFVGKLNVM